MPVGSKPVQRLLIFVAPVVFLACMLWIKLQSGGSGRGALYEDLNYENHLIQNLQALFYSASFILLFVAARRFAARPRYMRWVVLLAGVLIFFIVGEEIQWGQDIFRFQPPQYFANNNLEGELNLHNMPGPEHMLDNIFILVGLLGGFGWLVPETLVPWLPLRKRFIPPWYLTLFFLPLVGYGFLWKVMTKAGFLGGLFGAWRPFLSTYLCYCDQEPAELLFASACLILALSILQLARQKPQSSTS